jgi:hypothetical protein
VRLEDPADETERAAENEAPKRFRGHVSKPSTRTGQRRSHPRR